MVDKLNSEGVYFTSQQADYMVSAYAESQARNKSIALNWGIPSLDIAGVPLFPGQVAVIQACSHEGKTTFMSWEVRRIANMLKIAGVRADGAKPVIVYAKNEETVELARVMTWGEASDFKKIATGMASHEDISRISSSLAGDPIVYLGIAVMAETVMATNPKSMRLSPSKLFAIHNRLISDMNYIPVAYMIDGLQLMQSDGDEPEKWRQVLSISNDIVSFAKYSKAALICTAQSKLNEVKSRKKDDRTPRLDDIQHSSQIAQDADVVIGLWKPSNDPDVKVGYDVVHIRDSELIVRQDMVVGAVCKYRLTNLVGTHNNRFLLSIFAGGIYGNIVEIPIASHRISTAVTG